MEPAGGSPGTGAGWCEREALGARETDSFQKDAQTFLLHLSGRSPRARAELVRGRGEGPGANGGLPETRRLMKWGLG